MSSLAQSSVRRPFFPLTHLPLIVALLQAAAVRECTQELHSTWFPSTGRVQTRAHFYGDQSVCMSCADYVRLLASYQEHTVSSSGNRVLPLSFSWRQVTDVAPVEDEHKRCTHPLHWEWFAHGPDLLPLHCFDAETDGPCRDCKTINNMMNYRNATREKAHALSERASRSSAESWVVAAGNSSSSSSSSNNHGSGSSVSSVSHSNKNPPAAPPPIIVTTSGVVPDLMQPAAGSANKSKKRLKPSPPTAPLVKLVNSEKVRRCKGCNMEYVFFPDHPDYKTLAAEWVCANCIDRVVCFGCATPDMGRDSEMIMCDGCLLRGAHFACLGLDAVPDGKWYCAECVWKWEAALLGRVWLCPDCNHLNHSRWEALSFLCLHCRAETTAEEEARVWVSSPGTLAREDFAHISRDTVAHWTVAELAAFCFRYAYSGSGRAEHFSRESFESCLSTLGITSAEWVQGALANVRPSAIKALPAELSRLVDWIGAAHGFLEDVWQLQKVRRARELERVAEAKSVLLVQMRGVLGARETAVAATATLGAPLLWPSILPPGGGFPTSLQAAEFRRPQSSAGDAAAPEPVAEAALLKGLSRAARTEVMRNLRQSDKRARAPVMVRSARLAPEAASDADHRDAADEEDAGHRERARRASLRSVFVVQPEVDVDSNLKLVGRVHELIRDKPAEKHAGRLVWVKVGPEAHWCVGQICLDRDTPVELRDSVTRKREEIGQRVCLLVLLFTMPNRTFHWAIPAHGEVAAFRADWMGYYSNYAARNNDWDLLRSLQYARSTLGSVTSVASSVSVGWVSEVPDKAWRLSPGTLVFVRPLSATDAWVPGAVVLERSLAPKHVESLGSAHGMPSVVIMLFSAPVNRVVRIALSDDNQVVPFRCAVEPELARILRQAADEGVAPDPQELLPIKRALLYETTTAALTSEGERWPCVGACGALNHPLRSHCVSCGLARGTPPLQVRASCVGLPQRRLLQQCLVAFGDVSLSLVSQDGTVETPVPYVLADVVAVAPSSASPFVALRSRAREEISWVVVLLPSGAFAERVYAFLSSLVAFRGSTVELLRREAALDALGDEAYFDDPLRMCTPE